LEKGESGTRRENIPGIAKAIEADLQETYRKAGYSPPVAQSAQRMPDFIDRFNDLPQSVQDDLSIQINALWKKYAYRRKSATK
jgi:hypothetical protein